MQFAHPSYLWFLILLLPIAYWYLRTYHKRYSEPSFS